MASENGNKWPYNFYADSYSFRDYALGNHCLGETICLLHAEGNSGHGHEVGRETQGEGGLVGTCGGVDEECVGLELSEETDDESH